MPDEPALVPGRRIHVHDDLPRRQRHRQHLLVRVLRLARNELDESVGVNQRHARTVLDGLPALFRQEPVRHGLRDLSVTERAHPLSDHACRVPGVELADNPLDVAECVRCLDFDLVTAPLRDREEARLVDILESLLLGALGLPVAVVLLELELHIGWLHIGLLRSPRTLNG